MASGHRRALRHGLDHLQHSIDCEAGEPTAGTDEPTKGHRSVPVTSLSSAMLGQELERDPLRKVLHNDEPAHADIGDGPPLPKESAAVSRQQAPLAQKSASVFQKSADVSGARPDERGFVDCEK